MKSFAVNPAVDRETLIGYVFTLGVIISLIVGSAIVQRSFRRTFQRCAYATLKAKGYTNVFVTVALIQAAYLAVFSFIPAAISLVFIDYGYWRTAHWDDLNRLAFVLALTLAMPYPRCWRFANCGKLIPRSCFRQKSFPPHFGGEGRVGGRLNDSKDLASVDSLR
jgi:hypothetical protein